MARSRIERQPEVLPYRVDPSDGMAAFVIGRETSGKDVTLTLAYLNPDFSSVLSHLHEILRFAVQTHNVAAHLSLPLEHTAQDLTTQSRLVTHVSFGPRPTYDDLELTLVSQFGAEATPLMLGRLGMASVDTGRLLGRVVEVQHKNEFDRCNDSTIAQELAVLTANHYDL